MEHIRKIQSMGSAIRIISIICLVFLGIAAVALLAAMFGLIAASITLPAEYQTLDLAMDIGLSLKHPLFARSQVQSFFSDVFSVSASDSTLLLDLSLDTITCKLTNIWAILVTPVLQIIAWFIVLCFVCSFAGALKQSHSPFTFDAVRRLKHVGWSLLFAATLPSIIGAFICSLVLSNNINITIHLNVSLVLFVLIFLLLVYVFSYGANLQEESDATL